MKKNSFTKKPKLKSIKPLQKIFDYQTNSISYQKDSLENKLYSIKTIELSIDYQFIYLGGYDINDIIAFEIGKPGIAFTLKGHTDCVFSIRADRTNALLVSGGRDQVVIFWETAMSKDKKLEHTIKHKTDKLNSYIHTVQIAEKARQVFVITNSTIYLFDSVTFEKLRHFNGFYGSFNDSRFAVDSVGSKIFGIASSSKSNLKIHRIKKRSGMILSRQLNEVSSVLLLPKRNILVCGDNEGRVRFCRETSLKMSSSKQFNTNRFFVYALATNSSETRVFAGMVERRLDVFEIRSNGKIVLLRCFSNIDMKIEILRLLPDDSTMVVGGKASVKLIYL